MGNGSKNIISVCCFLIGMATLLVSCSTIKNVPAEDYLYTGATVVSDSPRLDKSIRSDLLSFVKPEPNSKILGMPIRLYLYNAIKEPKKPKGILYKLKHKWGQPPVLLSETKPVVMDRRMGDELFAKGFLRPAIKHEIIKKERKASLQFSVNSGERYTIRNIYYPADSTALSTVVRDASKMSLLKRGDYFDLAKFRAERDRISAVLKENGYYYFEPDFLLYRVDSLHQGATDLHITLKGETPQQAQKIWTINDITIYNNYTIERDSGIMKQVGRDERKFTIIDKKDSYKTGVYDRTISIQKGQKYATSLHSLTIERLMNLNNFRFVKMAYLPDPDSSKQLLNTRIFLTPAKKQSLRLELSGNSKSNNYVGSEVSLSYKNVNLARGAEILDAKITVGADVQVGGQQVSANTYNLNGEVNLYIPKLIPRFRVQTYNNPYLPRTVITPAIEYSNRTDLYTVRSIRLSAGYIWKRGKSIEQNFRILHINSLDPRNITPKFDSILATDAALKASFEKQLIIGSRYLFQFNNTYRTNKRFNFAFDGGINTSGNLAGLFVKQQGDTIGSKKVAGIPLSQFVRLQADFRGYLQLNSKFILVNRVIVGVGFAYGNSAAMPYSEQFFIGGSSSVRAFRARTLGPGSYHTTSSVYQAYESGDFKFEGNSELRFNASKYVKLAAFVDAGNIWFMKELPDKPGSGLGKGEFFREMAVGAGLGLRFDASVLVLRFDLSMPLRKPWYPIGDRWVFDQIKFSNRTWRKENLVLNIGIGYPF